MSTELAQARITMGTLTSIKPTTGSYFVHLFLGEVNVRVPSKADADTLREEYERFKDKTNWGS